MSKFSLNKHAGINVNVLVLSGEVLLLGLVKLLFNILFCIFLKIVLLVKENSSRHISITTAKMTSQNTNCNMAYGCALSQNMQVVIKKFRESEEKSEIQDQQPQCVFHKQMRTTWSTQIPEQKESELTDRILQFPLISIAQVVSSLPKTSRMIDNCNDIVKFDKCLDDLTEKELPAYLVGSTEDRTSLENCSIKSEDLIKYESFPTNYVESQEKTVVPLDDTKIISPKKLSGGRRYFGDVKPLFETFVTETKITNFEVQKYNDEFSVMDVEFSEEVQQNLTEKDDIQQTVRSMPAPFQYSVLGRIPEWDSKMSPNVEPVPSLLFQIEATEREKNRRKKKKKKDKQKKKLKKTKKVKHSFKHTDFNSAYVYQNISDSPKLEFGANSKMGKMIEDKIFIEPSNSKMIYQTQAENNDMKHFVNDVKINMEDNFLPNKKNTDSYLGLDNVNKLNILSTSSDTLCKTRIKTPPTPPSAQTPPFLKLIVGDGTDDESNSDNFISPNFHQNSLSSPESQDLSPLSQAFIGHTIRHDVLPHTHKDGHVCLEICRDARTKPSSAYFKFPHRHSDGVLCQTQCQRVINRERWKKEEALMKLPQNMHPVKLQWRLIPLDLPISGEEKIGHFPEYQGKKD